MATEVDDKDVDTFIRDKASIRKVLSGKLLEMQRGWEKELPEARVDEMHNALVSVLADLTADVAVGAFNMGAEDLVAMVRSSHETSRAKREAVESGAYV
jgi:hypothetical protein